ncbi:hypothetical protein HAX54_006581 [Datura stramonium]|uniref:Uncharacterized protein n=1 Tax=Datura stramonium TaxID=4076 RepID=A0ABS8TBW9_DATST|nr:hypothetical protein [Datura stramonium]
MAINKKDTLITQIFPLITQTFSIPSEGVNELAVLFSSHLPVLYSQFSLPFLLHRRSEAVNTCIPSEVSDCSSSPSLTLSI